MPFDFSKYPVNKLIASVFILITAIAVPAYFFRGADWSQVSMTPTAYFLAGLYCLVVIGFIFILFGKTGPTLTSAKADKKMMQKAKAIDKQLVPIYWLLIIICGIWLIYLTI